MKFRIFQYGLTDRANTLDYRFRCVELDSPRFYLNPSAEIFPEARKLL